VHAYSDWYYYVVMNPVDRIQTVWIWPDPHILGSGRIRIQIQIRCTSKLRLFYFWFLILMLRNS